MLSRKIRMELFPYMRGVLRNHDCNPIQIGGVEDHIHILLPLERTVSIAKVVERTKTSATSYVKERYDLGNFAWQAGYGAISVGPRDVDAVVHYIQNQEAHHHKVSFKDEYLALLIESGIEYDERYIWD